MGLRHFDPGRGGGVVKSFTFVHTADLHLDKPMEGWRGGKDRLRARREEFRRTFERIVELAKRRQADFLFIAGDLLEHRYAGRSTVRFVMEKLEELSGTNVLIAPGNHDPCRPDSWYRTERWPDHVHIFSPEWEHHYFSEYNLHLYGKGFADYEESSPSLPEIREEGGRRILVAHGTLTDGEESSPYFPLQREALAKLEMDYVALGHIHQSSTVRLSNERRTLVRYPGSPEAVRWKETGERTVTVGTFGEDGLTVETVAVQTRRCEIDRVDVTGCETPEEAIRRVMEKVSGEEREAYRRIHFTGHRPRDWAIPADWASEQLSRAGFHYAECVDETVPDYDLEQLRRETGVVGVFVRRMEERIRSAEPEEQRLLKRALYKGLDALLSREVVRG